MKLIVGLGNPGNKYSKNLHNSGFIVVDEFAKRYNLSISSTKFNGVYSKASIEGITFLIAKPMTFMNLSGEFIFQLSNYFGVSPKDILVIHDDKDIDLNVFKYKFSGSHAGQNGVKNIIQELSTDSFNRLRIDIRPNYQIDSIREYVLSNFTDQNLLALKESDLIYESIKDFIKEDFLYVSNKYN